MGIFDLFRKKAAEDPAPVPAEEEESEIYSGMRVEVTTRDGRLLFTARLSTPLGDTARLYQFSETALPLDSETVPVCIRGYNDRRRTAVYMEGVISPEPKHVWHVSEMKVIRTGNDRAFFRLDTDIEASMTIFGGFGAGDKPCRMLNISVGGACIATEHPLREGDKFLLKVKLLEDRDLSVMYCQVLRMIQKDGSIPQYGCRFLELTESDQDRITQNIFAAQLKERNGSR